MTERPASRGPDRRVTGTIRRVTGTIRRVTGTIRRVTGTIRRVTGTIRRVTGTIRHSGVRARAVSRRRAVRRLGLAAALLLVSVTGTVLGVLLAGRVSQDVGPFAAQFAVTPAPRFDGGSEIDIPPLGSVWLRSHTGPAHLVLRLGALDQRRATALINDPRGIDKASSSAVEDIGRGVTRLVLQTAGVGVLGAVLLGALVFRNTRRVAICGALALVTLTAVGATAKLTFRPGAVEEPRYEGLLVNAPAVIGDARRIADQYDEYKAELQRMVRNVSELYATLSSLPVYQPEIGTTRVLHISDMHLNPAAWSVVQTTVAQFGIDLVIDTGDLNDWGTPVESSSVSAIGRLKVPYVFIRGNHDSALTVAAVAGQRNAIVLQDRIVTVHGLTIAGTGDPRFTPDPGAGSPGPAAGSPDPASAHQALRSTYESGERLADTIRAWRRPVDIALVHDPACAGALAGAAPLVLAGHLHHREVRHLLAPVGVLPTTVLVEGSTGGAGLRGLEGDRPTPMDMTVLYFEGDRTLRAYDDITVGGTGQSQVTLQRHVVTAATPAPTP